MIFAAFAQNPDLENVERLQERFLPSNTTVTEWLEHSKCIEEHYLLKPGVV